MSEYESEWLGGAVQAVESKSKVEADQAAAAAAEEEAAREEIRRKDAERLKLEQQQQEERQKEQQRAAAAQAKAQAQTQAKARAKKKAERKAKALAAFLKTHEQPAAETSVPDRIADLNSNPSDFSLSATGVLKCRSRMLSAKQKREQQERAAARQAGVNWLADSISELAQASPKRTTKRRQNSYKIPGGSWDIEHVVKPRASICPEKQLAALNEQVSSLSTRLRDRKSLSAPKRFSDTTLLSSCY